MNKVKAFFGAISVIKNWPTYFAHYFGISGSDSGVYELRNGISLELRPKTNDRVIFNQVWLEEVYGAEGFEIKNSDTVVDIGAHIGFFTVFAALRARSGRVFAFEPEPKNFEMLRENIARNKLSNVFLENKAVSNTTEIRDFIVYSESTAAHSFAFDGEDKNAIKVPTVSFEEYLKNNNIKKIDFLKIDCEGAEYEILFNLSSEILEKIAKIAMEYHNMDNERNVNKMEKFLNSKGFKVSVQTSGDSMLYAIRK